MIKKTVQALSKKKTISRPRKKEEDYNKDFFNWTEAQVRYLKLRQFEKLDLENLVEEIESLGRRDKRALQSHLMVLLTHYLKKKFQPEAQGNSHSWEASIQNAEIEIELILKDSSSLKKLLSSF